MTNPDRRGTPLERRTVLSMVAAGTVGLAGCMGGGGDGGDGGDGGNGGGSSSPLEVPESGPSDDPGYCGTLLDTTWARYDESDSPFVATFQHPAGDAAGVAATGTFNDEHSLTIRATLDGEAFDVFPTMNRTGTEEPTSAMKGEVSGLETVGTIEYAGETLPVVRASAGSNGDDGATRYVNYPYYVVGVPHEGSSGKRYHRYDFRATVQFADGLEAPVCSGTWEVVARRMIASLEPNEDTTVGSA